MNQKKIFNTLILIVIVSIVTIIPRYSVFSTSSSSQTTPPESITTAPVQNSKDNEWQIFQDSRYNFRFEYPVKWSVENQQKTTRVLILKNRENNEIITIDTGMNLAVIGISYCGAYPQDSRCEVLKTDDGSAVTIDWGEDKEANAMFISQNGNYGVNFALHKINSDTKTTFRKILSTFRFLK